MRNSELKIAIVSYNSINARSNEYWGNTEASGLSGAFTKEGIDNDLYLLLMSDGMDSQNAETVSGFVEKIISGGYNIVIFSSYWIPELPEALRNRNPNIDIAQLDDRKEIEVLYNKYPELLEGEKACFTTDTTIDDFWFEPNMDYIVIGNKNNAVQSIADVMSYGCDYVKSFEGNPYYESLDQNIRAGYRGCSYCSSANQFVEKPSEYRAEVLYRQVKYLCRNMSFLEKVQLPHPQVFFDVLSEVIVKLDNEGVRPFNFYIQPRADIIVNYRKEIESILEVMSGKNIGFQLPIVGLENYSRKELLILNRGYEPEVVKQAIKIIGELKDAYEESLDTSGIIASFIMFNPFTEIEDLKLNVEELEQQDFGLFKDLNFNKVRINPRVALYALAEKEGLISFHAHGENLSALPRGGFQDDILYKFKNSNVQRIQHAYQRACETELLNKPELKIYTLKKIIGYFE